MYRFVAFILLLSTTLFNTEPVVGELYDLALHHESAPTSPIAESGSREANPIESSVPSSGEDSPGPHAEHCTHQHGTVLSEQLEVVLGSVIRHEAIAEISTRFAPSFQSHFRPPRL